MCCIYILPSFILKLSSIIKLLWWNIACNCSGHVKVVLARLLAFLLHEFSENEYRNELNKLNYIPNNIQFNNLITINNSDKK